MALARSISVLSYAYHQGGETMRARLPSPVSGYSLESQFGYIELSPHLGQVICHAGGCHAMAGVYGGHGATQGMTCEACQLIR